MALILDGNGLIQGLSAGGLPDGSIDADSLASTLDLSSKTMTFGNVTASGITFPASATASGNPNTLDDYEEGTFTATVIGSTTAGTATYSFQSGRYTKIGNKVSFTLEVLWSSGTGTGTLRVAGLPFTSFNGQVSAVTVGIGDVTMTASNYAFAYVLGNEAAIQMRQTPVGGGGSTSISYDSAGELLITGVYEV